MNRELNGTIAETTLVSSVETAQSVRTEMEQRLEGPEEGLNALRFQRARARILRGKGQ